MPEGPEGVSFLSYCWKHCTLKKTPCGWAVLHPSPAPTPMDTAPCLKGKRSGWKKKSVGKDANPDAFYSFQRCLSKPHACCFSRTYGTFWTPRTLSGVPGRVCCHSHTHPSPLISRPWCVMCDVKFHSSATRGLCTILRKNTRTRVLDLTHPDCLYRGWAPGKYADLG